MMRETLRNLIAAIEKQPIATREWTPELDAAIKEARRVAMTEFGIREQVLAFHRKFGQPIAEKPAAPAVERSRLRIALIAEEFCEFLQAAGVPRALVIDIGATIIQSTRELYPPDVEQLADALGDLDYVVEGTRLEYGINGEPIAAAIHAANMAKEGGRMRADGKILKPAGWMAPDIAGELRKQGWDDNEPT